MNLRSKYDPEEKKHLVHQSLAYCLRLQREIKVVTKWKAIIFKIITITTKTRLHGKGNMK